MMKSEAERQTIDTSEVQVYVRILASGTSDKLNIWHRFRHIYFRKSGCKGSRELGWRRHHRIPVCLMDGINSRRSAVFPRFATLGRLERNSVLGEMIAWYTKHSNREGVALWRAFGCYVSSLFFPPYKHSIVLETISRRPALRTQLWETKFTAVFFWIKSLNKSHTTI